MKCSTEARILSYLEKRIKAQERLLVAYRTALDTLSDTQNWEDVLKKYRARALKGESDVRKKP